MIPNNKPYLIGETAFHHEGDKAFLEALIQHALELKLDAIKFHLLIDLDDYMVKSHKAIEVLRPLCLTGEDWTYFINKSNDLGLDVIALCNDVASIEWIIAHQLPVKVIELHATGLNDFFLLKAVGAFSGTIMLGVGGSTIDEIDHTIRLLNQMGKRDIFLMYGFQNYPTLFEDINLAKIKKLSELFDLPIGYADHTDPKDEDNEIISTAAIGLGCNVLEKHFTHRFGEKRIDSQSAVSLEQMKKIKRLMHKLWVSRGSGSLEMSNSELKYGNTGPMKKAIVAKEAIGEGEEITLQRIAFKRTNESSSLSQKMLNQLLGLKASKAIQKDEIIDFSKVSYSYQEGDISQFFNK